MKAVMILFACAAAAAMAQSVDQVSLSRPPSDTWPTYHGDYSGRRHSTLAQITPANVKQLALAWAFQTGQPRRSSRPGSSSTGFCM